MSGADAIAEEVEGIGALVARLIAEHRQFPMQVKRLNDDLGNPGDLNGLVLHLARLQDTLTEHMLTEEFEFYPEIMKRGLFDETVSGIMQQHHNLTASLGRMEQALRLKNLEEFKSALDELNRVLKIHQPAEEEKVFPLVA